MSAPIATAATSTHKRWNAFVCQDCRGIFRAPADYQGKGVVCPICDRMLRLPRAGEILPCLVEGEEPEVVPQSQEKPMADPSPEPSATDEVIVTKEEGMGKSGGEWRRRKKERQSEIDVESEWQKGSGKKIVRFSRGSQTIWWALAAVGIMAGAAAVVIAMRPEIPAEPSFKPVEPVAFVDEMAEQREREKAALKLLAREKAARAVIEQVYQAQNVETLLPLLRPVEGLEQMVRSHHALHPLKPGALERIDEISPLSGHEDAGFLALVRLRDYRNLGLAVLKVGEDYRLDWESWVGWSEMDYATLLAKKPTTAVEVRVTVTPANYYNYDFPTSVENEWQCYRMSFANETSELYGYIPRTSRENGIIMPTVEQRAKSLTLRIRYKDANSYPTQVLIDSVVADGWIEDLE